MTKIDVLDNGFVRLVDSMGSDLSIVRAARVSYNAEWRSGENERNDIKLINYLWRNKHTTPFEAVTFTFEVKAPIFVIRQWHRHRTWSYNEVSGRYSILPNECYVPKEDKIGVQSKTNHQSRILDMMNEKANEVINASAVRLIKKANYEAFEHYNNLLIMGIPREVARMILPLNTIRICSQQ
jgi:thymidylate synthase (FAD)